MHLKKYIRKAAAVVLSAALAGLFGTAQYYSSLLPDTLTASSAAQLEIAQYPEISCSAENEAVQAASAGEISRVTLSLLGTFPVKNVSVKEAEAPVLAVGGRPFGIKLLMEGVMVTGLGDVEAEDGQRICPAEKAGIRVGDIIHSVNGKVLTSNTDLQEAICTSEGSSITLIAERNGSEFTAELTPVYSAKSGKWRGGMWVRDSIAGIGTMTFINKETGQFAGLGHPICDADTGELVPLHSGEAVPVEITEAVKGRCGIPGELRGDFTLGSYGTLDCNNGCGIFGVLDGAALDEFCTDCEEFPLAYRQEIKTGAAEIYTTVEGGTPKRYSAVIESIDYSGGSDETRNMVIRITDEALLEKTGGIVQGMSGSPLIQNGKLVGAVTHVFVSDPAVGYAVFAETMAECLNE